MNIKSMTALICMSISYNIRKPCGKEYDKSNDWIVEICLKMCAVQVSILGDYFFLQDLVVSFFLHLSLKETKYENISFGNFWTVTYIIVSLVCVCVRAL